MSWTEVQDLPENWGNLVSSEVDSLAEAWFNTYQELSNTVLVETFNEKLRREWSIETGIIERLYTIDSGTTRLLIEQGIDAALMPSGSTNRPVSEVIKIISAQRQALDGLYDFVASGQELSLFFIRSLHQLLMGDEEYVEAYDQFGNLGLTELIKGNWRPQISKTKRLDGSIHDYCPPEHLQSEMERVLYLHKQHMSNGVAPQVEAAWLHHRFTQVHPFQDGNGRIARCLATLVLIQARRFPLMVTRDQRKEYLEALREADNGDLSKLVQFFDSIEKRAYIQALNLSEDVLHTKNPVISIIDSIVSRYRERKEQQEAQLREKKAQQQARYNQVIQVAGSLQELSIDIFGSYATRMREEFEAIGLPIVVEVHRNDNENIYWYQGDIVETAKQLDYYANLTRTKLWTRLWIEDRTKTTTTKAEIVASMHYLGKEDRGVMIATAFLNIVHKQEKEDEKGEYSSDAAVPFRERHTIITEGFTFAYTDTDRSQQRRLEFQRWLEQAIAVGLAEWQKQI